VPDVRLLDDRLGHASALETHRTTNNTAIAIRIITPFSFWQIVRSELGRRTKRVHSGQRSFNRNASRPVSGKALAAGNSSG